MIEEHDTKSRTLAKTLTWRVTATLTTMFLVYMFTGELSLSVGIGIFEVILKMLFYFIHERVWDTLQWGKKTSKN